MPPTPAEVKQALDWLIARPEHPCPARVRDLARELRREQGARVRVVRNLLRASGRAVSNEEGNKKEAVVRIAGQFVASHVEQMKRRVPRQQETQDTQDSDRQRPECSQRAGGTDCVLPPADLPSRSSSGQVATQQASTVQGGPMPSSGGPGPDPSQRSGNPALPADVQEALDWVRASTADACPQSLKNLGSELGRRQGARLKKLRELLRACGVIITREQPGSVKDYVQKAREFIVPAVQRLKSRAVKLEQVAHEEPEIIPTESSIPEGAHVQAAASSSSGPAGRRHEDTDDDCEILAAARSTPEDAAVPMPASSSAILGGSRQELISNVTHDMPGRQRSGPRVSVQLGIAQFARPAVSAGEEVSDAVVTDCTSARAWLRAEAARRPLDVEESTLLRVAGILCQKRVLEDVLRVDVCPPLGVSRRKTRVADSHADLTYECRRNLVRSVRALKGEQPTVFFTEDTPTTLAGLAAALRCDKGWRCMPFGNNAVDALRSLLPAKVDAEDYICKATTVMLPDVLYSELPETIDQVIDTGRLMRRENPDESNAVMDGAALAQAIVECWARAGLREWTRWILKCCTPSDATTASSAKGYVKFLTTEKLVTHMTACPVAVHAGLGLHWVLVGAKVRLGSGAWQHIIRSLHHHYIPASDIQDCSEIRVWTRTSMPDVYGLGVATELPTMPPPTMCMLCGRGFKDLAALERHCTHEHGNWQEYRKRLLWLAQTGNPEAIPPWYKRMMVQNLAFFQTSCLPGSGSNSWLQQETLPPCPRRDEACVVCARLDFLEHRYPTNLWSAVGEEEGIAEESDEEIEEGRRRTNLLVKDGVFQLGPAHRVNELLCVARYAESFPCIPPEELEASAVVHPRNSDYKWLLHKRRVPCDAAGAGLHGHLVWLCKDCRNDLCKQCPKMPKFALANHMWVGREVPLYQHLSLGMRLLLSRGRCCWRKYVLGKGSAADTQKGLVGNTIFLAQPNSDTITESLPPPRHALQDTLVVIFSRSLDDLDKAQVLKVQRQKFLECAEYRKRVCSAFADVQVREDVSAEELPDDGVPLSIRNCAVHIEGADSMPSRLPGIGRRYDPTAATADEKTVQGDPALSRAKSPAKKRRKTSEEAEANRQPSDPTGSARRRHKPSGPTGSDGIHEQEASGSDTCEEEQDVHMKEDTDSDSEPQARIWEMDHSGLHKLGSCNCASAAAWMNRAPGSGAVRAAGVTCSGPRAFSRFGKRSRVDRCSSAWTPPRTRIRP